MKPDQYLHKAVLLLDRGRVVDGESTLRQGLRACSGGAADLPARVQLQCCLAELLYRTERRAEVLPLVQEILALQSFSETSKFDDLLDREFRKAQELRELMREPNSPMQPTGSTGG